MLSDWVLRKLARDGHVFLRAIDAQPWRARATDWSTFAASWNDLPLDRHMADGGLYRRRRHAVFVARGEQIERAPHRPHFQSREYNPLNGDVPRDFAPITVADGATLRHVIAVCNQHFSALTPTAAEREWDIEVHQFRIEATAGAHGLPTPEGVHRDGVDWVMVLLVNRVNIASGTTTIHQPDGALLGSFTLTDPGDVALIDDHRVFHGVTAVTPVDASVPAFRDVLVVTFRTP